MCVCVYTCMCVFRYVYAYVCWGQKLLLGVFLNLFFFFLFWARASLSTWSEPAQPVWLASQWTQGTPLSLRPQHWDYSAPLWFCFHVSSGDQTQNLMLTQQVLYQFSPLSKSPKHSFSLSKFSNAFWSSLKKKRLNLTCKIPDLELYAAWSWIKNKNLGLFKSICFGNKWREYV